MGFRIEAAGVRLLSATVTVPADATATATRTLLDDVAGLALGKAEAAWLDRARNRVARGAVLETQTPTQVLALFADAVAKQQDLRSLSTRATRLTTIGPAEVAAPLSGCTDREVLTVIGPAAKLTDGLVGLGLEVETVPWQAMADAQWARLDAPSWKAESARREAAARE